MKIALTTLTPENIILLNLEDDVIFVDPDNILIKFDSNYPLIYKGKELRFDLIPCRNTIKTSYSCLFKVAADLGLTYDPVARFSGPAKFNREFYSSKLSYNIPSYFFFSVQSVYDNHRYLQYPLITKADRGTYGEGISIIKSLDELKNVAINFDFRNVLFLQQLLTDYREYRVTTFDDEIISIVRKHKSGLVDVSSYDNDCLYTDIHLIMENLPKLLLSGLYGIDIAIKGMNEFYIFEQNRSPEFFHLPKKDIKDISNFIRSRYDKNYI